MVDMKRTIVVFLYICSAAYAGITGAQIAVYEGDYLYRVSTVRAAPGKLDELIKTFQDEVAVSRAEGGAPALMMRHSQGDQWDLLLLYPMTSFVEYFGQSQVKLRNRAADRRAAIDGRLEGLIAFREDVFAVGPSLGLIRNAHRSAGLFHVEMFHALPGRKGELLEQRRMENRYLSATGQQANMIFSGIAGSDVDVFTIGYHANLVAFARPAAVTPSEAESAAKIAGFENRGAIGTYLRELISHHHDTLAVAVSD